MTKIPVCTSLLLFMAFLIIGCSLSSEFYQRANSGINPTSIYLFPKNIEPIKSLKNGQRSILLIGVDSLGSDLPLLENTWLMTFLPTEKNLNILPIFSSGDKKKSEFSDELEQSFGLNRNNNRQILSKKFIKILEQNNYWWSGYLIFDRYALREIMTIIGNEEDNADTLTYAQSVREILEARQIPQAFSSAQLATIRALCQKISDISERSYIQPSISLSDHVLSDMEFNQLNEEWNSWLSNNQSPICRFPTLEISTIDE